MRRLRPRKPLAPDSSPRERALDALALRRRGYSLRRAADLARTDPRTVRRHVGSALRKNGGRWVASPFDRIPREMTVLTTRGPEVYVIRDSRTASLIAEHANAAGRYVERGDDSRLRRLPRRRFRVNGEDIDLAVDPVRLDRLAQGGELHYELYRR
jgi:DNA-binding CsgD family transcriptional regulator